MKLFDLDRFIKAQNEYSSYEIALQEINAGKKRSHWIWYIFPQMQGLGHSVMSHKYGIESLEEARAYYENALLKTRLREITEALLKHDLSAINILGGIDASKVRSCMTLFNAICPNDIFKQVLDKFYDGKQCRTTLKMIQYTEF